MKKYFIFSIVIVLVVAACSKELGLSSTTAINERIDSVGAGGGNGNTQTPVN